MVSTFPIWRNHSGCIVCWEMKMTRVSKRNLIIGGALGLLAAALAVGAIHPFNKASATVAGPPPTVEVVPVQQKDVPIFGEWIGTLDGLVNADVRAQVTGYL